MMDSESLVNNRIYAASLTALKDTTYVCPSAYIAASPEEAKRMALEQCQELWPATEGYRAHTVTVLPVPSLWYTLRPRMKRKQSAKEITG